MLTDAEIEEYRVQLVERRAALRDQAMALEIARRRERELIRVEAALKRVEAGEYGDCLTCGEEIAEKRLQFDPATPVCIGCAA